MPISNLTFLTKEMHAKTSSTDKLVELLIAEGVLKSPSIIDAFKNIDRADFVPVALKHQAYVNAPLLIGQGQTSSQPLTVAFMLELLEPKPGENILDIGSGSGWQTALLAHIICSDTHDQEEPGGQVTGLEIIPELHKQSITNIARYNFIKRGIAKMFCQSGADGFRSAAPYNKIIAAAALNDQIPSAWLDQLKLNGRLVAPVGNSLVLITKKETGSYEQREYPGFVFVPFV